MDGALVTTSNVVGLSVIDEVNADLLVVVAAISMIVLDGAFCAVGTVLLVILGGLFVLESPFDEFCTV